MLFPQFQVLLLALLCLYFLQELVGVVNTAGGLANNIVNKAGGIVDRGFNTLDKGISGVTGILSNPLLWIAVIAVGVLVLPKLLEARTGGAR